MSQVFAGFDKPGYDTANVAVISNETHNTASQMGGAQTDQEQFNNVNVWYNNSWQPFGLTNRIQEDQPYYHFAMTSVYSAVSWDRNCTT